jgi:integrase
MAQIQKRSNSSYFITVNLGRDVQGKKVRQTMTYTPTATTPKQIEKEVQRQAVLFEEACKQGQVNTAVKFQAYADDWFANVAPLYLKKGTIANYRNYSKRVYKAIGHLRMDRVTARELQRLVTEMSEGERADKYKKGKLSAKTVRSHIAWISTIYQHAIKQGLVSNNPCRSVTLPKIEEQEQEIYSIEETQRIINLIHQEEEKHFDFKVYFTLAIFTGFRRGELLGLEFSDFDFERSTLTTRRASKYVKGEGIFTDTLKTRTSYRTLKLPDDIMALVLAYKRHQAEYAASLGDRWNETDRLFTQWHGLPMHPNAPALFFERFCKKHGIEYINPHGLRHGNASMLIFGGVDVRTVSQWIGHSTANTTLKVYSHAFQAANAAAMDKLTEIISLPTQEKTAFSDFGHQTDIKPHISMKSQNRKPSLQADLRLRKSV